MLPPLTLCVRCVANMPNELLGAQSRHIISLVLAWPDSFEKLSLCDPARYQIMGNFLGSEASMRLETIYGRFNRAGEGSISAAQ